MQPLGDLNSWALCLCSALVNADKKTLCALAVIVRVPQFQHVEIPRTTSRPSNLP